MKLHGNITINRVNYAEGSEIPWYRVYPFFLLHMLMFGGSGFLMAYGMSPTDITFLYLHGGFAILIYTIFYLVIFGLDDVKWMFINAGLGVLGLYTQVSWLLSLFGKNIKDYPFSVHVVPFLYYVLYSFLVRHALLDLLNAHEDEAKKEKADYAYIGVSAAFSLACFFLENR